MREFIVSFETEAPLSELTAGTTVRAIIKTTGDCGELVRCKDCKHRPKQIGEGTQGFNLEFPDWECPCQCDDPWYNWMPEDDWYCGNGERKEE